MAPKKTEKKVTKPQKNGEVKKKATVKKASVTKTQKAPKPRKPKAEARKPATFIAFVLDRSGSMSPQRDSVISGFNEYLDEVREKLKDKDVLFSMTQFDTSFNVTMDGVPLSAVAKLDREGYTIGGMTALYDAIGVTVQRIEDKVKSWGVKPDIMVVVLTDGHENSSRIWNHEQVRGLISKKQDEGWTFAYLGATEDAWDVGVNLGVHAGNVAHFTFDTSREVIGSGLSTVSVNYSSNPGAVRSRGIYKSMSTADLAKLQNTGISPFSGGNKK